MALITGTYNLGPDHSLVISRDDTNAQVILDGVRSKFNSKYDDEVVKGSPIDLGGIVIGTRVPGGISGSIEVERATDDFDALVQFLDANYYAQGPHIRFTMTETILNADRVSSVTNRFVYTILHGYDRGNFERAGIVKCTVQFFSSLIEQQ